MKLHPANDLRVAGERGSVFILVLWIAFGLVTLALYFANSMSLELRAADNRAAGAEAQQAINAGLRYALRVCTNVDAPGRFPDQAGYNYAAEDVPVGDAAFWLIGRSDQQANQPGRPAFGLVDEASKLNLNTATAEMLQMLPRMTPELAGAIIDWRDANSIVSTNGGAEDEVYARMQPARRCKNARFETVEELRLVYGMTSEILFGEDANLNGVLDPNENDGDLSEPGDNSDGRIDPGLLEFVTVYSREPNKRSDGSRRINVANAQGRQQLAALLQERLGSQRANQILANLGAPNTTFRSELEFYVRSRMSADEFAQIAADISASNNAVIEGRVNINTATETVLACIPGIGLNNARAVISYRQANTGRLTSVAWLAEAIDQNSAVQAGPYVTTGSYQFSADIAALGHLSRGFTRVKFVIDASEGSARVRYRRDLTHLGWALGSDLRESLLTANPTFQ